MILDVAGPIIVFGEEVDLDTAGIFVLIFLVGFGISLFIFSIERSKKIIGKANKKKLIISGICTLLCAIMIIYSVVAIGKSRSRGHVDPPDSNWVQE